MSYTFLISTDNGGAGMRAAQIMATDFKKIGIKLNLQVVNDTTLNNDLYGNHYRNFSWRCGAGTPTSIRTTS